METLEIAFVLVSFIAIAESVLLIWISQSYKTLIKRALGAAEGAVDTGEEILAEYRRTTDLNLAALAYIKALEHELAIEREPRRIEPDGRRAGGSAAQRLADRDLARAQRIDERIALGKRAADQRRDDDEGCPDQSHDRVFARFR